MCVLCLFVTGYHVIQAALAKDGLELIPCFRLPRIADMCHHAQFTFHLLLFLYVGVSAYHMHVVPVDTRRGHWIPLGWYLTDLRTTMGLIGIKLGSPGKATSVLHCSLSS